MEARGWRGSSERERGTRFWGGEGPTRDQSFNTVFMGVDNGVDNGSPPRLLDGHRVFEGGQLGGQ